MNMQGFDPRRSFGPEASRRYDKDEVLGDEEATVQFLSHQAAGRDALELAIGTGRIGLPLSRTGIRVDGIELSADMVERLREKPGGDELEVVVGDMARATTGRTYGMVYLVFNSIGNVLTQDDQVRCFENAAQHLDDDGVFVLECRVPDAFRRHGHQFVDVADLRVDGVHLEAARFDPVTQVLDKQHVFLTDDGVRLEPIRLRLAHPPEFDLMARIAGLHLRHRWGGWNEEPFTAESWRHISVYERAA